MTQRRAGLADHRLSCSIGPPPGPSDTQFHHYRNHCRYHYRWQSTAPVNGWEPDPRRRFHASATGGVVCGIAPSAPRPSSSSPFPGPTRSMHRAERVRRGAAAAFTSNAWRPDLDRRAHQPARCRSSRCRCFWASRRSRIGGPHARTLLVAMVDRVRGRDWSRQEPVFDATVASRDRCSP